MKKRKNIYTYTITLILAALLLILSVAGCASKSTVPPEEKLLGTWYKIDEYMTVSFDFTKDNIRMQYFTFDPVDISYVIKNIYETETETVFDVTFTEKGHTYDDDIVLQDGMMFYHDMALEKLSENQSINYTLTQEQIDTLINNSDGMVTIPFGDKEYTENTGNPVSIDPLDGMWRYVDGDISAELKFKSGVAQRSQNGEAMHTMTYKIKSIAQNSDSSATVIIYQFEGDSVTECEITIESDSMNYLNRIYTKVK